MRVAVTGAGGQLGALVQRRLSEAGHEVNAFSTSLPLSATGQVVRWSADEPWQHTADSLRGTHVVVHAAAHIPRVLDDPSEALRCVEVNAIGTLNLLRAGASAGVERFVYVSSANVLSPRGDRVDEDAPVGGEHAPYYLGSKVLGEVYVRGAMVRGLSAVIVRPSTIYGPGLERGVLWSFATRLRARQPIRVADGGRFRSDFVWRDDVASVVSACAMDRRNGALNVGSGHATSILEVAQMLCEVMHADPSLITVDPPPPSADMRPSGFAAVDITRAQEWFAYAPTPLRQGLERLFVPGMT